MEATMGTMSPDPDDARVEAVAYSAVSISADVITETEALRRYGHLLEDKELRRARQNGRLGYLKRKRMVWYRLTELQAFVDAVVREEFVPSHQNSPTQPNVARPRAGGATPTSIRHRGPTASVTPVSSEERALSAAKALEQAISPVRRRNKTPFNDGSSVERNKGD